MTKAQMFLQVAQPDSEGRTELWLFSELEKMFPGVQFQTSNGGDWNRSDGQLKDFVIHREKVKNRTIGIRLDGFKDKSKDRQIRADILKYIRSQNCRVLDVGGENIECDHKDGRYSSDTYSNVSSQNTNDFQPLHRNVNLSKRTHCNNCINESRRYDARKLGYIIGWYNGDESYKGSCVGCYWYDPYIFNKEISKHFKP
jgi:hypothetical protein